MSEGISSVSSDSLPPGWSLRRIDSLLRSAIRDFGSFSMTNLIEFVEQGVPFIKSESVANGHIDFNNVAYITEQVHRLLTKSFVNKGDVLFTKIGAIGRVAVYDGRLGICNSNAATAKIQIDPTQADATFFAYKLGSERVMQEFEKTIISTPPRINLGDINSMKIECPPLPLQRKIARILTTVDNLIEKTEALIAKYQAIKQGMMHDLFTRGVDEHGHLRPAYEEAPEIYKPSELGWIPSGWEVVRCSEVCREIVVGIVIQPAKYYQNEGVPVLRSANVRETGIVGTDLVFMSGESNCLLAKSMLRTGDVITVRTGYPGTSCVVSPEYDGSNCVDIIISRPGPRVRSQFLATWINSDSGKNQVLCKQGGLAQQHFNVGELKDLLVVLPSSDEQAVIESVLLTQKSEIQTEERQRDKLHLLKTGLMQDLLTGRVRVKVDEAEEVAV